MPLAPRPHPLVGRSTELDRLRSAAGLSGDSAVAGIVISGDAGIGKSRLVAEVADEAAQAGHRVVVGHCVGVGGSTLAWLPFVEIVASLQSEAPEAVTTTTTTHPALRVLRPGDATDGTQDPGRVAEAVHALLTEAARERPLLVVVEDVHWADHSSRDLLTLLLTRGFAAAVTLVVTYRSDDVHRRHPLHDVLTVWTRLPLLVRADLEPLSMPEMHRLVRGLDAAPPGAQVSEVVERSGGNPFFAEELVASGDATSADLARLLRLRLDRLDEPGRRVVRAASLAGGALDPDLLGAVVGMDPDDLDDALHQAIDHHILEAIGETLRFRHSLLGETLAEELLPGARRRLHRAWIDALRAHPGRGSPADLARHAAATGDTETAITAAVAAGDEALRIGGARDAQRLYEAALGWIADDPVRRAEITVTASRAADRAGDSVRAIDLLEEVLPELTAQDHPRQRARVLARAASKYTALDLPSDPVAMSTEAMGLLPEQHDAESVPVALDHLDVLVNCRWPEAIDFADELLLVVERLQLPRAVARVRMQQARLLAGTDPDRAYAELIAAVDDPAAGPDLLLPTLLRLGNLDRGAGRMTAAFDRYARGVAVAEREQRSWGPYGVECRLQGGRTAYELGRWSDAERLLSTPPGLPQPTRGFMESALVELLVARGERGLEHRLDDARAWWDVDALLVVGALGGMIDALGRAGEVTRLLEWVVAGVESMQRAWGGDAQAIIRIAALLAGQTADLSARDEVPHDVRSALRETTQHLAEQARGLLSRAGGDPGRGDGRLVVGPESLAWGVRLEAELLRVERPGAASDESVAMWQQSADAFAALPNLPEQARSLLRLTESLSSAGRSDEATATERACRDLATQLGARPVLDALDAHAARPAGGVVPGPTAEHPGLTPREREVLVRLDLGRTNGEIATELFISRKTVSVHVSNILAKVGARTRGEAVSIARERGLLG